MALVRLRGPLKTLAGGGELPVAGDTIAELLGALERERPALHGLGDHHRPAAHALHHLLHQDVDLVMELGPLRVHSRSLVF